VLGAAAAKAAAVNSGAKADAAKAGAAKDAAKAGAAKDDVENGGVEGTVTSDALTGGGANDDAGNDDPTENEPAATVDALKKNATGDGPGDPVGGAGGAKDGATTPDTAAPAGAEDTVLASAEPADEATGRPVPGDEPAATSVPAQQAAPDLRKPGAGGGLSEEKTSSTNSGSTSWGRPPGAAADASSDAEATVAVDAHTSGRTPPGSATAAVPPADTAAAVSVPPQAEEVDLFGSGAGTSSSTTAGAPAGSAPAEQPPAAGEEAPEEPRDAVAAEIVSRLDDEVVVIDEKPRYHVTGCRALVATAVIPLPVREAVELGFTPCGWCSPDRTLAGRHRTAAR
jgi:hypothetical protein